MNSPPLTLRLIWEEMRPLPEPRAGGASAIFGRGFLLAGGTNWKDGKKSWLDRVDIYDFDSGEWRSGPTLPRAFAYGSFAVTREGFELIGGCDAAGSYRTCLRLESEKSAWRPLMETPQAFLFGAAESWDGALYVFGGCANDRDLSTAKDTVWMRDYYHRWHRIAGLPQGNVIMCAHASAAGRAYCFGGCTASPHGTIRNHDDVFSFDYRTHAWTRRRPLPVSLRGASAVALDDHRIAVLGGYGTNFLNAVLIYDVDRDLFLEETSLPVGLMDAQCVLDQVSLYAAGGEDGMRSRSSRLLAGKFVYPV
jgi:N-acetylneuraminic acid mutarotase